MKRTLGASYLYCVVLIEILPQVQFYPTECDQLVQQILVSAFRQVSYRDPAKFGNNYSNSLVVAEIFAEIIGVISQTHFERVHRLFSQNLDALRKETPFTSSTVRKIISLLMAMKFFRIKVRPFSKNIHYRSVANCFQTNQVDDFEMGVRYLNELGQLYLDTDLKQKDLKHALGMCAINLM